ncbi:MAG: hypothetical protein HQ521_08265 [Bacteroidetes bacterium]|nr:hypothetical protein [Bacteroidota bacterium]
MQVLNNLSSSSSNQEEANESLQSINDELWAEAIEMVQKDQNVIKGLGERLAFEITRIGEKVVLTNSEIEELPAIKAWHTKYTT